MPESAQFGPNPEIPPPTYSLFTPIALAPPLGWSPGQTPTPGEGLSVRAFSSGLEHPRWLYVLPNGDVLVAETDGGNEVRKRPKDFVMGWAMHRVHAELPRDDRITLLRDTDNDGVADTRTTFISGLNSAFGMALVGNNLYVANTDALLRFPYRNGVLSVPRSEGVEVAKLPAGPINHHWTKSLIASPDGRRLYVGVGANSNVAENGMENEAHRAAVLEIDPETGKLSDFATGIRNPVGMAWEPSSGALWVVANERDEIGDNAAPDYLTAVKPGAFYGWPYAYWGQHVDRRAYPARPDLVARSTKPDYALGSHGGTLGLTFATGANLGPAFRNGAFISQHGSWNRSLRRGYQVLFVPFTGGRPAGLPKMVLSGFLAPRGNSYGRPVGLAIDRTGGLLVADDAGNMVWRLVASK